MTAFAECLGCNTPDICNETSCCKIKGLDTEPMVALPPVNEQGERLDGPTIAEYVAAGYNAESYPPEGYASRSTPEEVAEPVAATQPAEPVAAEPVAAEPVAAEPVAAEPVAAEPAPAPVVDPQTSPTE